MKGKLIFNLPEDEKEFRTAQDGHKWKSVAREMDDKLRTALKHGHSYKTADEALQGVRDELNSEIEQHNLSLYD